MHQRTLHIVSLQIPFPVTIGASYELFYKLKAFHAIGVRIILHCFHKKGDAPQPELEKYCIAVHYYERSRWPSLTLPYIVSSRRSPALAQRLLQDNHPILLDGTHCTSIIQDARFARRKIIVRKHNVEHQYYLGLANSTGWSLKKLYYLWETKQLQRYEAMLCQSATLVTLSHSDYAYFKHDMQAKDVHYVPVFFEEKVHIPLGLGQFCLYHGNLSVSENEQAVLWLLQHVFNDLDIPFVVAGKNPSSYLIHESHKNLHTCIAASPTDSEMHDLIAHAQINILPSINATGVKFKVLNALHFGRHCITNLKGSNGFSEKELFLHAETAHEMKQLIVQYFEQPFTQQEAEKRKEILQHNYNLQANAHRLLQLLE
jgi:hypothetical protein